MQTIEFNAIVFDIHRLRINVRSLAEEARIIRKETQRCGPAYRNGLTEHRRGRLREESRFAHLCLAFLRKRPYVTVEQDGSKSVDARRIVEKLRRLRYYNEDELTKQVKLWLSERP